MGFKVGVVDGNRDAEGFCVSVGVSEGDGDGAGDSVGAGEAVPMSTPCTNSGAMDNVKKK